MDLFVLYHAVYYSGRGCACAVVSPLCHLLHVYMCDSGDSELKMLSANAARPIFSARNEAIGWEEAYDSYSVVSTSIIHAAIHHQLK